MQRFIDVSPGWLVALCDATDAGATVGRIPEEVLRRVQPSRHFALITVMSFWQVQPCNGRVVPLEHKTRGRVLSGARLLLEWLMKRAVAGFVCRLGNVGQIAVRQVRLPSRKALFGESDILTGSR